MGKKLSQQVSTMMMCSSTLMVVSAGLTGPSNEKVVKVNCIKFAFHLMTMLLRLNANLTAGAQWQSRLSLLVATTVVEIGGAFWVCLFRCGHVVDIIH
jgi:hypothetical protein